MNLHLDLHFNMFNVLVLFGAIQGIILCVYLVFYKKNQQNSLFPFVLFLFSLAYINLYYALLDIDFFAVFRALHIFPYPAKWLIGPAIFFYVKSRFNLKTHLRSPRLAHLLFLPGILINLPFFYWFAIAWKENSYSIVRTIAETDFFRYNEIVSIVFNLILLSYVLGWIKYKQFSISSSTKEQKKYKWLTIFIWTNLIVFFFNLQLVIIDLIQHDGQETMTWYYGLWILYTLFIYAMGLVGFSNADLLLSSFKKNREPKTHSPYIEKLKLLMIDQKLFKNPDLRLGEIASLLTISPKELSQLIKAHTQLNFSAFINQYRIEDVKEKLLSPAFEKFTLIHLAKESGFNSKSSFNEIFKAQEGMSPSAYRKKLLNSNL